jgi:cell division transport system ATP-binding protein
MNVLSRINASGTTVIMATHDSGIVDQMQRRVIEVSAGRIVRDEHEGGYQTASIPFGELDTAPTSIITDDEVARATPIRSQKTTVSEDAATPFPWELRA